MKKFPVFLMLCSVLSLQAQLRNDDVYKMTEMNNSRMRSEIHIPDFNGYQTLKCDFHIHTVFSDGKVWPDIRVAEAWQEGLDAIAITDHIEYRPNREILKGDLNESYKIAKRAGDAIGFMVIHGAEITRSKPLGHLNALFISDAIPMDVKEPLEAIDEAIRQGAFIMWNHPGWPDDKSTMYPVHEELIKAGKIHGVEVFNHMEYYPVSFDWCRDKNLAFMSNTDIHDLITTTYGAKNKIRPMTLVLAKERSIESIKEALFAKRSIAYFDGELVGKPEHLKGLLKASVKIRVINEKQAEVTNVSDITYRATAGGNLYVLPAQKTILLTIPGPETVFIVENCYTGNGEKLTVTVSDFQH
ncbi:MAG: PHP domain-containing protein [Petrimonas sp.]|uniref:PHP domain-containing protein n=1 Tax=Petrimonas sp. TaxID=2023866 RepID=UPI002B3B10C4|nr:PHP domain-containing protein [Petrimonas sp.]MEA5044177.1 PHP domain-containing protein [Petrimonas sp.]